MTADDLSPTEVARMLGSGSPETQRAGSAYEHIVYQMYTMLYENYTLQDLTGQLTNYEAHEVSLGEKFCILPRSDQDEILRVVNPLWLPGSCREGTSGVLFRF